MIEPRPIKRFCVLIFILVFAIPSVGYADSNASALGYYATLQSALKAAKNQDRPALVTFSASWCAPCKVMKRDVFPHPNVQTRTRRFVHALLDTDTDAGGDAYTRYAISGLPTTIIVTPNGKEFKEFRMVGAFERPAFEAVLDAAIIALKPPLGAADAMALSRDEGAGSGPNGTGGGSDLSGWLFPSTAGIALGGIAWSLWRRRRRPSEASRDRKRTP